MKFSRRERGIKKKFHYIFEIGELPDPCTMGIHFVSILSFMQDTGGNGKLDSEFWVSRLLHNEILHTLEIKLY